MDLDGKRRIKGSVLTGLSIPHPALEKRVEVVKPRVPDQLSNLCGCQHDANYLICFCKNPERCVLSAF